MSDMETRFGLAWNVTKPRENSTVESSRFSFLDSEWSLKMNYYGTSAKRGEDMYYEINLNQVERPQHEKKKFAHPEYVKKYFRVTTFIARILSSTLCYTAEVMNTSRMIWKFDEAEVSEKLPDLVKEGATWTVICAFHCVEWYLPERKTKEMQILGQKDPDLEDLSAHLGQLLKTQELSDVQLKCGDRMFPAHKAVLAARSKVFRSKLANSESGVLEITDLEAGDLDLLLKYMYSGKLQDVPEDRVRHLHKASIVYDVHSLKKACADHVAKSLTENNCIEVLTVAHELNDVDFKDVVMTFICDHQEVLQSTSWLRFAEESPILAMDVYQRYVSCTQNY